MLLVEAKSTAQSSMIELGLGTVDPQENKQRISVGGDTTYDDRIESLLSTTILRTQR